MSDHHIKITIDSDGYLCKELICEAPPESFCHVENDCGCEALSQWEIKDGVLHHLYTDYDGENEVWHTNPIDPDHCIHSDWFIHQDECLDGTAWPGVILPVEPQWEDGYYRYVVTPEAD